MSTSETHGHRHAAVLRGINLGKRRLKLDELRRHFEEFGFSTYVFVRSFSELAWISELPGIDRGGHRRSPGPPQPRPRFERDSR